MSKPVISQFLEERIPEDWLEAIPRRIFCRGEGERGHGGSW